MIRLLLVSRDHLHREQIARCLAEWHLDVDTSENSAQAFALLINAGAQGSAYSTALVDQRQLDMDPLQFATSVRAESSLQDLKLILIAPPCAPERTRQLIAAGYVRVLETPLNKTLAFNALHAGPQPHITSSGVISLTERLERNSRVLPPQEILLAESSESVRRAITRTLERDGHHVFSVSTGEQAMDALESHSFDLAILEQDMPVMKGIQVVKLHNFTRAKHRWTPFILLVKQSSPILLKQCAQSEVCSVLTKPVGSTEILAAATHVIRSHLAMQQHAESTPKRRSEALRSQRIPNSAILDESVLHNLDQFGVGKDFVADVVAHFIREGDDLIGKMEHALVERNFMAFGDAAHAFVDNAGYLGAVALFEYSSSATRIKSRQFETEAYHLLDAIKTTFASTRDALARYLEEQSNTQSRS